MTMFGPQAGPPKVRCLFCHYAIPHEHHNGEPPLLPCPSCWVGIHDMCDPTSWFCACLKPSCIGGPA